MKKDEKTVATNRHAKYNYDIIETCEAGIELKGSEVKSVRAGRVNLKDSFAAIDRNGLFLCHCHISPYEHTGSFKEDPTRRRKLLMHKLQITRLLGQTAGKGYTLVPLRLYFTRGLCKVELALARGKKLYDKRRALKEKEVERELRRVKK